MKYRTMGSDLCFTSLTEIARRIDSGDASPVEVVDAYLERIDRRKRDAPRIQYGHR